MSLFTSLIADSVPVSISRFMFWGFLPHFLHGWEAEAVSDPVLTQTS